MNTMHRRTWMALAGAGCLDLASAQSWQEGTHYLELRQPVAGPPGKVEVVEFFWYGCGACNAFEPALQDWVKTLPPWVEFRHQHLFLRESSRQHQRLFFTLQAMGVESKFRSAIFAALHQRKLKLETVEQMVQLLQPLGLDAARFRSSWAAFEPGAFSASRIEAANKMAATAYQVASVPTLVIGGRYVTTPVDASERKPEKPVGAAALRLADHFLSTLRPT